ncbi:MAG: GNAT family N-acetyltransferase, partial [Candidatus Baltobacteraceae bacterium]
MAELARLPDVPVIETDRLRLRGHRLHDFNDSAAMWADPVVTRYIGGQPSTEQQSWARVRGYVGHWSLLGFGYWVVEAKTSGAFIGEVGFADFKRQVEPSIEGIPEIGWVLISAAHGKGYATEAVRAAVAWGDNHFDSKRTVCMIDPENLASLRVAEKCGYHEFERTTYNGEPTILLARLPWRG